MAAHDRRVQAARDLAQLVERHRDLAARARRSGRSAAGSAAKRRSSSASSSDSGDQALLGAVVEVALEPRALALAGLDHAAARAAQLLEPGPELGVQAVVLEGDAGRRADGVEQLGLVVERRVVHERRDALAVAVDQA